MFRPVRSLVLVATLLWTTGCEAPAHDTGLAGGACYPNATCNAGLSCVAGTCVGPGGGGDSSGPTGPTHVTLSVCAMACKVPADCCAPGTPGCPGAYPANWSCEAGYCEFGGCTTNSECTFGGVLPTYECHKVSGSGTCFDPCGSDSDCAKIPGTTCSGVADDGTHFCQGATGCSTDQDCGQNGHCDTHHVCVCGGVSDCHAPPPAPGGWGCRTVDMILSSEDPNHGTGGDTVSDGSVPGEVSIADLQTASGSADCTSDTIQNIKSNLVIRGTVTTPKFSASPSLDGYYVADGSGAASTGIQLVVDKTLGRTFAIGDRIVARGEHTEYYCMTEFSVDELLATESGGHLADAVVLGENLGPAALERYEGMLVEFDSVQVVDKNTHGEAVTHFGLLIDGQIMGASWVRPAVGATFRKVVGILHYAYGAYRIAPRTASDLVPF